MKKETQGFSITQYVPSDYIDGNSIKATLKGAEVIGDGLEGTLQYSQPYNDIQIKLTDGRVIRMHGYFTEGY